MHCWLIYPRWIGNAHAGSTLSEVDRTHAMALHSPARENIYLKNTFMYRRGSRFIQRTFPFRPFGLISRDIHLETEGMICIIR